MEFTTEHIQLLLVEKLTGTIAAEDNQTIEHLLRTDEAIRRQWEDMLYEVQQAQKSGFVTTVDAAERWQTIKPYLKEKQTATFFTLPKVAMAAAILGAMVIGIWQFISPSNTASMAVQRTNVVPDKPLQVTLALDNGQAIALSNTGSGTFQLGHATVETNGNQVSYSAATSSLVQWNTLMVPATRDYKIKLADGTEIWLNAESKLRFPHPYNKDNREVFIEGEAYFKVAKDKLHPFVVHTPKTDIWVTGTQFNVNTYNRNKIETALVEGSVTAKSKAGPDVHLQPGHEVIYNPATGFHTQSFDQSEVLSWMKGVYYFHNIPLQDLAQVLSRWYQTDISFDDITLKNRTFSGELVKQQPLQLFLDNLKLTSDVQSYLKNGVVHFK